MQSSQNLKSRSQRVELHADVKPIFPSIFSVREIPNFANRKEKPDRNLSPTCSGFTGMKRQGCQVEVQGCQGSQDRRNKISRSRQPMQCQCSHVQHFPSCACQFKVVQAQERFLKSKSNSNSWGAKKLRRNLFSHSMLWRKGLEFRDRMKVTW